MTVSNRRITPKLGEAVNEFNGMTRNVDDNEILIIREKCQAISNSILRLSKEIRTTKSELDALNTAKHEILLQQKEIDDRNTSFTENLQRQIESIALANEKYRKKLIEHLKSTNVTLSSIPAIENDVKTLQETCINNQTQMTTLQKRFDLIAEEVLNNQNQSSLFKTEAVSDMTHLLTPIISKLQEEIHAIKGGVIEGANTNEKSGFIDPSQFEAVIEPFVAKVVSEMNKSLVTDLRNSAVQHREKESKKLHALFKDLKYNLRNSLGRRFYNFSQKITLLQQEEVISRMQQHMNDLEARFESFIEDHLINNIRARIRECDVEQFKNQSTISSSQKDQCTPIINVIHTVEEWINSIVSIALLPFTLKGTENSSYPPEQTLVLEGHNTRENSNVVMRNRDSKAREICVRSTYENSEKQSQTEHQDYCVSNSINPPPACYDYENLKEQLRKEAIEQASAAFENRLQGHFFEFKQLMCEKIEMLFASYNTELTRIKVDAEAIYRFHRAIEKKLDSKLSFLHQEWSEELRHSNLELASLSARCDQGQMQQQCLHTAFNSVSDLALKFHERVDDVLAQITCLKEEKGGKKDLNLVKRVDIKPCSQDRTDAYHGVIDEGDIPQQARQAENNGIYKEDLHHQTEFGSEHFAVSVVLDKMGLESKGRLHSLSSEEYSKDETKSKEQQLEEFKSLTLPHLLPIPLIAGGNLSEKNDCNYYSPQIGDRNKDLQEESDDEGNSSLFHRKSHCQHDGIIADQISAPKLADNILNSFQKNHTQYSTESFNDTEKSKVERHSSEISPLSEGMRSAAIVPTAEKICSFMIQHKSLKDNEEASATSTPVDYTPYLVNVESGNFVQNQVVVDDTQQSSVYMDYQQHADKSKIVDAQDQDLLISDEVSECNEVTGATEHSNEGSEVQYYSFSFESSSLR